MPETAREETIMQVVSFKEKPTNNKEPVRCVDGRNATESPQGPQLLGGSLHPLVLDAIVNNADFDNSFVTNGLTKLKQAGIVNGVHWGPHRHGEASDCGFGDRLIDILQTAKDNGEEITRRLEGIYSENGINTDSLRRAYELISNYDIGRIKITGKKLIELSMENGAVAETLEGDHGEQAAFVNIKPHTTLDTMEVNKQQGTQAFNLDLWSAVGQSSILAGNTEAETLRNLSLILYMATEMVLVEQKGKPTLPVALHK